MSERYQTFEIDQPWVVYSYLTTDRKTRITGRSKIKCTCGICGHFEVIKIKIPRIGKIKYRGKHPKRIEFLKEHSHPDRRDPMTWAMPLLNPQTLNV